MAATFELLTAADEYRRADLADLAARCGHVDDLVEDSRKLRQRLEAAGAGEVLVAPSERQHHGPLGWVRVTCLYTGTGVRPELRTLLWTNTRCGDRAYRRDLPPDLNHDRTAMDDSTSRPFARRALPMHEPTAQVLFGTRRSAPSRRRSRYSRS